MLPFEHSFVAASRRLAEQQRAVDRVLEEEEWLERGKTSTGDYTRWWYVSVHMHACVLYGCVRVRFT